MSPPTHHHPARDVLVPEIASVEDVARHLGLSRDTVRRLIRRGTIPARKLSGRWYVGRRALLGLFESAPSPGEALLRDLLGTPPRGAPGGRLVRLPQGRHVPNEPAGEGGLP